MIRKCSITVFFPRMRVYMTPPNPMRNLLGPPPPKSNTEFACPPPPPRFPAPPNTFQIDGLYPPPCTQSLTAIQWFAKKYVIGHWPKGSESVQIMKLK